MSISILEDYLIDIARTLDEINKKLDVLMSKEKENEEE